GGDPGAVGSAVEGPGVDVHRLHALHRDRVAGEAEGDRLVAVGQQRGAGRQAVHLEVGALDCGRVDRAGQVDDVLGRGAPDHDGAAGGRGAADDEGQAGREAEIDRHGAGAGVRRGGVGAEAASGEGGPDLEQVSAAVEGVVGGDDGVAGLGEGGV